MDYLFTSESVSEGHPDKVADQISDAILDAYLAKDPNSKVACETLVTSCQVIVAGEVKSNAKVDVENIIRTTVNRIGYNKPEYRFDGESCGVINLLHKQSEDISRGVEREEQGAGDQGIMFGYATNETDAYMPLPIYLANLLTSELAAIRKEGKVMTYLRPDAKSQVTIAYDRERKAKHIDTIVVSTQHDEFASDSAMHEQISADVKTILLPRVKSKIHNENISSLIDEKTKYLINPTGKFVIGGPYGDTGLTGRKIIVDTYGGKGAHGGGAFSGKDPSKVDRSAAYMARYIAKNMVAAGVADEMLVQLSYAIGVAQPVSVNVQTFGTCAIDASDEELADYILDTFDMRPKAITDLFNLCSPIYEETAAYGHFGRSTELSRKEIGGKAYYVKLFPWEELSAIPMIKSDFKIA